MSICKITRLGMPLMAPGCTRHVPVVATVSGLPDVKAACSTAKMSAAALAISIAALALDAAAESNDAATTSQPFAQDQVIMNKGTQNLGAFGYFGEDPYLLNIWVNSDAIKSGFNWEHYDNPQVDAAIAKANATADTASRNAQYEAVCMTLMEAAVYLPLWEVNGQFTMSPKVSGIKTTLNGYILFTGAKVS